MTDHITDFLDAMKADGIPFTGKLEPDGKLHRFDVDGDRKGSKTGWYVLHIDERPVGQYGCNKRLGNDAKRIWTAKGAKPLTREERAALDAKIARQRAEAEATKLANEEKVAVVARGLWERAEETDDHPYLRKKGIKAHGARVGEFIRALRPGPNGEPRAQKIPGALLIPLRGRGGKEPWSLQAIYPDPLRVGPGDFRNKDFLYQGRKLGQWFAIGRPTLVDGVETFCLCEGFATGASIHQATGLAVIVTFDAGNLVHVARIIREMKPKAQIVICADNDQFTVNPATKEPENPGWKKACLAADDIGGKAIRPEFRDLETKPTDFNDLATLEGEEEVRRQIMAAISPAPPEGPEEPTATQSDGHAPPPASPDDYGSEPSAPTSGSESIVEAGPAVEVDHEPMVFEASYRPTDTGGFFEVLGYDGEDIYIRNHRTGVILGKGLSWWKNNLTMVAPAQHWEFMGLKKDSVVENLFNDAVHAGRFNLAMARGLGAWQDDGRNVFYLGDSIMVDGRQLAMREFDTDYIYYSDGCFAYPGDEVMTTEEGNQILRLIQRFTWARNSSPILLAGWMALSPICGALEWRPHIWLTGPGGSGKSSVQNHICHWLLQGYALYAQGNSTEAGLRQTLMTSARPVILDEGEQNSDREQVSMQAIIALARQSSSGTEARTYKGGKDGEAQNFMVRSMFCFAAIQVGLQLQQDKQRVSVLHLRKPPAKSVESNAWGSISEDIDRMKAIPDIQRRFVRRAVDLLPVTLRNIETFREAAAAHFGSQRLGDQYGTLIAGAWSMVSDKYASMKAARELIGRYDWTDYTDDAKTNESVNALEALALLKVFVKSGVEPSVRELVMAATGLPTPGINLQQEEATRQLAMLGIQVDGKTFAQGGAMSALLQVHANSADRDALLRKAGVSNLRDMLLRLDGVVKASSAVRINGFQKQAVLLPLIYIVDGYPEEGAEAVELIPEGEVPLDLDDQIDF